MVKYLPIHARILYMSNVALLTVTDHIHGYNK
jgi:hypothetical protein